jgi:ribosomal protein S11
MRYILHIKTTVNNIFFNITDFRGNTLETFSAKSSKFKSKQVRRTIVLDMLWEKVIQRLKFHKCKNLSLHYTGHLALQHKTQIFKLFKNKFKIKSFNFFIPVSFNGCKVRHFRRV